MQHEVLAVLAFERVDDLLVLAGAQRGDAERLRLAAGEQRGAMGARQDAHFGDDLADGLGVAAVDAQAGVQDGVADDVRLQVLELRLGQLGALAFGDQRLDRLLLHGVDRVVPCLLGGLAIGFGHTGAGQLTEAGLDGALLLRGLGQRPGIFRGVLGQFDDRLDHRLERLVAEIDGAEHDLLGQFLRFRLHHQHALGGAGDHQVELGVGKLLGGRVEQVLAVPVADAGGADRAEERDAR